VGNDALGSEALARLAAVGLQTNFIQVDAAAPTGIVKVEVGAGGQPHFQISEQAAWDGMEWTEDWEKLARRAAVVCYGSLAQRSPQSRATIQKFLQATTADALRVFDVNLRHSFYSAETLADSLRLARIAKLNDEELPMLLHLLGVGGAAGDLGGARRLQETFDLDLVCLTRGAHGSLLVGREAAAEHAGFAVEVVDTVGAGDAYTAALVHYYRAGLTLEELCEEANRVGAWVASQAGAMPPGPLPARGQIAADKTQIE
jgi:fructokinase